MYEVIVLKEGYSISEGQGQQKACGTITLIKGPRNIIVDTGNPWDKQLILEGLHAHGLRPGDIRYVVCSCGHSGKVGNLNMFSNATCIVAGEVSRHDHYLMHGFLEAKAINLSKLALAEKWLTNIQILIGLKLNTLSPDRIDFVVCTHGHSDHMGNLNLFPNAVFIVSHDVCVGDTYMMHDFKQGIPYEIDDDVEVMSTPGHTSSDVSVIVRNTKQGTVAITGDLFECVEDLEDYSIWQENSENPEVQQQNRLDVLAFADWIVPGHGPMFKVPADSKQQLKMVMYEYMETKTVSDSTDGPSKSTFSETTYTVIEEDGD